MAAEAWGQRDNFPRVIRCPQHLPMLSKPIPTLIYNVVVDVPTASSAATDDNPNYGSVHITKCIFSLPP